MGASIADAEPIVNDRSGAVEIKVGDVPELQSIFAGLFGAGMAPDVMANQTNFASFAPTSRTTFTFLGAVAGYKRSNVLGIYEANNPSLATRTIFDRVDISGKPNHAFGDLVVGAFSPSALAHQFGLFIDVYQDDGDPSDRDYTVYTDDKRNPGQLPQALVFFGNGQNFSNSNLGLDGNFGVDDIIIAFEDLNRFKGHSDDDFNDLIVLIEHVQLGQPVPPPAFEISLPEPASLGVWALVAGVGGFFGWRRRRQAFAVARD
jgi:MYXO-CTERM domain-containing protein